MDLAYEQLLSEGYIESKPYRGFFVAQIEGMYRLEREGASEKPEVREKEEHIVMILRQMGWI